VVAVPVTYHDLAATERDTLLAAATATPSVGDRPHKGDVYERVNDIAEWTVSRPTVYSAIDRLADAGLLRVSAIDGRAKGVRVTPTGVHVLHDAAERIREAATGDCNRSENATHE